MAKHLVTTLSDLERQKRLTVWLGRHEVMALITTQGVRVYSGMCPHQGGPLGEGAFKDDKLTCPWHGCTFELNQGVCIDIGACRNVSGMKLKTLDFTVDDQKNIYVELPDPA